MKSYINFDRVFVKGLRRSILKSYGRNNQGLITVRHICRGSKKLYRLIDFRRVLVNIEGLIMSVEYDPNRSSYLSFVLFKNYGLCVYNIMPYGLKLGSKIKTFFKNVKFRKNLQLIGSSFYLSDISLGVHVYNIESKKGFGGNIARAAGTFGIIMRKLYNIENVCIYVGVKLPSGKLIYVQGDCVASIGRVSNFYWKLENINKAGISFYRGKRPAVRGVAMNPVDHPHGGGEGKTSGGRISVSIWGRLTKGFKTRSKKKLIVRNVL